MRNNDGTPAVVDLQGAAEAIALMYRLMEVLGVSEDLSENKFWEARGLIEKHEDAISAREREACAKIAEDGASVEAPSPQEANAAARIARLIRARST